jgi:ribosomal protein S27AE
MKTIAEYLKIRQPKQKKHIDLYLDDKVKCNPREFCPECEDGDIKEIHDHDPDAFNYKCRKCGLTYSIYREYRVDPSKYRELECG